MPAALTASLSHGVLQVNDSSSSNDQIVIREHGNQISVNGVKIQVNGKSASSVSASAVTSINVQGGSGNELIDLNSGAVKGYQPITPPATVHLGKGNDTVYGGAGKETLLGGSGNDVLKATTGNTLIQAGSGKDLLVGGSGTNTLIGGSGDDTIIGGSGNDTIVGGSGSDTVEDGDGSSSQVQGTITAVDTTAMTVTITTSSGQMVLTVLSTTQIIQNDSPIALSALQVGQTIEAELDANGNLVQISVQGGSGSGSGSSSTQVEGTISAIDTTASTVTVTTGSGQTLTLQVLSTTMIEMGDTQVSLASLQVGQSIEAELDPSGNLLKIDVQTGD